ncbi:uncharacterized protein [Cherax quadricarinatus]|uniref:uncharacterized protein n=1 Tax=Cherax quadricarinatus TaxID=27406 RepID=UPI00387EDDEB
MDHTLAYKNKFTPKQGAKVVQLVGLAVLMVWEGPVKSQEDQIVTESSVEGTTAIAPALHLLQERTMERHSRLHYISLLVRKQLAHLLLPKWFKTSRAKIPIVGIGQQIGEYMRRISDYVYWFISGSPPVTRKEDTGIHLAQVNT